MRNKIIFICAFAGLIVGFVSAYIFGIEKKPQPPAFNPASNPYPTGIYANGIIESYQAHGANINIYPEVSGRVLRISGAEGTCVKKGRPLLLIDDSVQRATVEQQKAQVDVANAGLKNAQDQLDKLKKSFELDPRSVSKNDLDNAENAARTAKANAEATVKQYQLALTLLSKYRITAPMDGIILSINTSVGSYVSPQGTYDTYTQGFIPVLVMASSRPFIEVRCYVDEILVNRLPRPSEIKATMSVPGSDIRIPLEFERVQPYVTPKIELSNQRTERVDVRVLPVLFKCKRPGNISLYAGQLVDVFISTGPTGTGGQ